MAILELGTFKAVGLGSVRKNLLFCGRATFQIMACHHICSKVRMDGYFVLSPEVGAGVT